MKDRKPKITLKRTTKEKQEKNSIWVRTRKKVLLKARFEGKYTGSLFDGPYVISHVNMNDTVQLNRGLFLETRMVNIQNTKPFNEN
jgi:hypothetical protein